MGNLLPLEVQAGRLVRQEDLTDGQTWAPDAEPACPGTGSTHGGRAWWTTQRCLILTLLPVPPAASPVPSPLPLHRREMGAERLSVLPALTEQGGQEQV